MAAPPPPPEKTPTSRKDKLDQLIDVVVNTADAKGWDAYVSSRDEKEHRFATVAVSRIAPGTASEVTALFELKVDQRVRMAYEPTSFYSYGLTELYDAIRDAFWRLPFVGKPQKADETSPTLAAASLLEGLFRRLHNVIRQLKHRYGEREPFTVSDEYDLQDLLHAVLRGLFDDVRSEEYSPSYAGGASRLDFLLKAERIVIETKVAGAKLRDKQVGEQLIIDIKRYQKHPDCQRLICFVYDPGGFIKNPAGLESDLSGKHDQMEVRVIVVSL